MIFHMHQPSLFARHADRFSATIWPDALSSCTYTFVYTTLFYYRENELPNVEIIVADISKFEMERSFDRIISIEMFEV
jgi:cyclopropane fatty-acyl-phospholipid synthase-like methyltransferase